MSNLGKRQKQSLDEQQIGPSHKKRRRNIKDNEWRVLNFLIEEQNLDRANIAVMLCGVPLDRARLEKERNRHPISALERQAMRLGDAPNVLPPEIEIKLPIENLPWLKSRELVASYLLSENTVENEVSRAFPCPEELLKALSLPSRASDLEKNFDAQISETPIFNRIMSAVLAASNHFYRSPETYGFPDLEDSNESVKRSVLVELLTSDQAMPFLRILYRQKTPTLAALFEILFKAALVKQNTRLIRELATNGKVDLNRTVHGPWFDLDDSGGCFRGVDCEALLPLEVAVRTNDMRMAELLVDLGANLNAPCFTNGSLLAVAIETSLDEMVRLLIDLGIQDRSCAISYFLSKEEFQDARVLIQNSFDPSRQLSRFPSPLWSAVKAGNSELVRLLLDKGADPYYKHTYRYRDESPLLVEASCGGNSDIVRMLLVHKPRSVVFTDWTIALHRAASNGHLPVVEALLEHDTSLDIFFEMEKALYFAYDGGNLEIVKSLIEHEPELLLRDFLFQADRPEQLEMSQFLLQQQNQFDDDMFLKLRSVGQFRHEMATKEDFRDVLAIRSAMIWAIQSIDISDDECEAIIMSLANRGCDIRAAVNLYPQVNELCMPRPTPLSIAIHSRPSIVNFLLSNASNPDDAAALHEVLHREALHADVETRNFEILSLLSKAVFQSKDRPETFLKQFGDILFKKAIYKVNLADTIFEAGARPTRFLTHESFISAAKTKNAKELKIILDREIRIHSVYFDTEIPPSCLAKALVVATPSISKMRLLLDIGAPTNFFLIPTQRNQICCSGCSMKPEDKANPLAIAIHNGNEAAVNLLLDHGAEADDSLILKAAYGCWPAKSYVHPHSGIRKALLASREISFTNFTHEITQKSPTCLSKSECRMIDAWLEKKRFRSEFANRKTSLWKSKKGIGSAWVQKEDYKPGIPNRNHGLKVDIGGSEWPQDSFRKLEMLHLIDCVDSNDTEETKRLLEAGLDVGQVFYGLDPEAKWVEHSSIVFWSGDLDEDYVINRSPLQLAAQKGNMEMVQLLISYGEDINEPPAQEGGITALQGAAIGGFLQLATTLWEMGANVNAEGAQESGRTALEGAAEWGRIDMVQLLLLAGAKIGKKSEFGQRQYSNAVKYARDGGYHAVADLIERHRDGKP